MEESREEQGKKYAKLIAKAWSNESFKEKLLSDPRAVLEAEGIGVPPGVVVKVLEQTEKVAYLVIPKLPKGASLQVVEERYAAGAYCYSLSSFSCA